MAKRRSSYETYLSWSEYYGATTVLSEEQYSQVKTQLSKELKSQGKTTTNIAKTIASEGAFTYDYRTGRAIRKAYKEQGLGDISIREARNIMQYDKNNRAMKLEVDASFWNRVSEIYQEQRDNGVSTRNARDFIAQTIFGSP